MITGRNPAMSARLRDRAERLDDLTAENVATARTSVPPAVAIDEMVTQSARRLSLSAVCGPRRRGEWCDLCPGSN